MILRVLVALAMVAALVAAFALQPNVPKAPALLTQLGRFHILALHIPIGVLIAACLAEAGTLLRRHRRRADVIVTFLVPLLVLTGCAAMLLGLLLAHGESYPIKLLSRHRNLTLAGIMVSGLATFALPYRMRAGRWGHRALLFIAANLIGLGAHFGGSMTHGADFLFPEALATTKALPEETLDAGALAVDPPVEDASVVVHDAAVEIVDAGAAHVSAPARDASAPAKPKATSKQIVQAMVNSKCSPCHTSKSKGGLRLSDVSNISKAGEVVPGDPTASKMYTRLTLPRDHEDHMPPDGETQATAAEIAAVRRWIVELGALN